MPPRGYTLYELMIGVAVAAVAVSVALPSLERLWLDVGRSADVNAFVSAVQLARSEAAKRARPVVLCKTVDLMRCGGEEIRYDSGWMVFVNEDDARPPGRSPSEPLLLAHAPDQDNLIHANRQLFEFRPFRTRSTNGTVTLCDRRGEARAVIVSYTGRPRVSEGGPGRELTCAP